MLQHPKIPFVLGVLGVTFLAGCGSDGFVTRNVVGGARTAADAIDRATGGTVPAERLPLEAPDPGNAPYPNLGAFPPLPPRGGADVRAGQVRTLEEQRAAARAFDERLRVIDPVLDPSARPPEPPAIAAAVGAPAPAPVPQAVAPAVRLVQQPAPQVAAAPVTPAPQVQLRAPVAPAPVVVPPSPPPAQPRPPAQAAAPAPRGAAAASYIVGQVAFVEGTAQMTPDSVRDLRAAVIAANARGGTVRVTPTTGQALSPQDQVLTARRMAAIAIQLEALGLERARIAVEQGWLRAARVAVEY
jgi:hypothetical protein